MQRNRLWIYAVAALLVFQAGSVLHAYPAYISYTNEAFGGPGNSYKYVSDSSSEWGQQLNAVSGMWTAGDQELLVRLFQPGDDGLPLVRHSLHTAAYGRVSNPGHTACDRWHRADQRCRSFRV